MFGQREIFTFQRVGPVLRSNSHHQKFFESQFWLNITKVYIKWQQKNASGFFKTILLTFLTRLSVYDDEELLDFSVYPFKRLSFLIMVISSLCLCLLMKRQIETSLLRRLQEQTLPR